MQKKTDIIISQKFSQKYIKGEAGPRPKFALFA